ncbi:hypothetical protein AB0P31_47715, partial [Streptomyces sp. NPDC088357]
MPEPTHEESEEDLPAPVPGVSEAWVPPAEVVSSPPLRADHRTSGRTTSPLTVRTAAAMLRRRAAARRASLRAVREGQAPRLDSQSVQFHEKLHVWIEPVMREETAVPSVPNG